jgi:hypothetical protein
MKKRLCSCVPIFILPTYLLCLAGSLYAQGPCSNKSLVGAFGFNVIGTNVSAGLQFAINGRFVADGAGHFKGKATQSSGGKVSRDLKFTGTYTVQTDCTGSANLVFPAGVQPNLEFVLASDNDELLIIDSDDGTVESGVAKKQFPRER